MNDPAAPPVIGEADAVRAARGVLLDVQPDGPGAFIVRGGLEPHRVTLDPPACDCRDHVCRQRACKHLLGVLLRQGEPIAWEALGTFIRAALKAR